MIQLIILLGIISIIDFSTKKIPVVVLVVMGIVGIASSFYAKQSIISVAVALIPGIVLMAAAFLTGEQIGYGDAAVVTLMGLFVTADIVCSTMVMGLTIAGTISVILIASGSIIMNSRLWNGSLDKLEEMNKSYGRRNKKSIHGLE